MKTFFFSKKTHSSSIFFVNLNLFDFWQKTEIKMEKKHFQEIISFDTHSTAKLPPLPILKKYPTFSKKKLSYVFEKSCYLSRILRQTC